MDYIIIWKVLFLFHRMTRRDCFCFDRQRTLNAAVLTQEQYKRLKDFIY